jgi:hypothetical protein
MATVLLMIKLNLKRTGVSTMNNNSAFINFTLRDLGKVARLNITSALRTGRVIQPIMMLGAPGSGKTQWATRKDTPNSLPNIYAECLGISVDDIGLVVEKPARRDASEMAGVALPMEDDDGYFTEFSQSPIIRKIIKDGREYGILVLDEAAAAGLPEQKVLSDCFDPNEHSLGGNPLPRGWMVIGTGNRAKDKAGSLRLLSQNISRVLCANIVRDTIGWAENFCVPHGINPIMVECALAHDDDGFFADEVPVEQVSYNTYRSTVAASYHLDEFMQSEEFVGVIPPWVENLFAMNMGQSAAKIVSEWVAQRDHVPTADEIMRDPENAKVPDQTGFQMISANIAMGAVKDVRSATAALHYIVRLRKDLQISLGVKLMNISSKAGWLVTDPLASAFIAEYHEFLPIAQDASKA